MRSRTCRVGLVMALSGMLFVPCEAQVSFQIFDSGTTATAATLNPGAMLTLDVVATSITGNLDSFTYRIAFPNQQFTLMANAFAAPFDNTLTPAGNNGSVPWSALPVAITYNADAASPGHTPLVADLYRTTATTTGTGVTGPDFTLETLTFQIPSSGSPTTYPISLNVLEAADNTGLLVSTTSGIDFTLTVIPEPTTTALAGAMLALHALSRAFGNRGRRRLA